MEKMNARESVGSGMNARNTHSEESMIVGRYAAECYGADGVLKWREEFPNTVVTVGKNEMLDKYLAGSSWSTGTVYMGLKGTGTPNAADTMSSHASWSELNITASSGARQSVTFSSASAGAKATSSAVAWSITTAGPTTVAGCFIVVGGTSANANTTGTLFSAGDFSSSRSVLSGDTLNITYSVSI